jgi:hypothetical protein
MFSISGVVGCTWAWLHFRNSNDYTPKQLHYMHQMARLMRLSKRYGTTLY